MRRDSSIAGNTRGSNAIQHLLDNCFLPGGKMKKQLGFMLFAVLALALCVPPVFAQASGSVKGICKDAEGKPVAGGGVGGDEMGKRQEKKNENKSKREKFFPGGFSRREKKKDYKNTAHHK